MSKDLSNRMLTRSKVVRNLEVGLPVPVVPQLGVVAGRLLVLVRLVRVLVVVVVLKRVETVEEVVAKKALSHPGRALSHVQGPLGQGAFVEGTP